MSSTSVRSAAGASSLLAESGLASHAEHSRISAASTPGASAAHTSVVMARRASRTAPCSASHGISRTRARSAGSVIGGSSFVVMIRVWVGANVTGLARIALPVRCPPPVSCLSRSAARWPRRGPSSMNDRRRPLSAYTTLAWVLSVAESSRGSAAWP